MRDITELDVINDKLQSQQFEIERLRRMMNTTHVILSGDGEYWKDRAERAEAQLAAARREALEEAAKKCDKIGRDAENDHPNRNMGDSAFECAAAIRALAEKEPK